MQYRPLGSFPEELSVLGLGALHFGAFLDEKESVRLIERAIDRGVTFIDTAPAYGQGQSEAIVGKALESKSTSVAVSTKVGLRPITRADNTFGVALEPLTRETLNDSVDRSLKALGIETIDLLQLHAFDPDRDLEALVNDLDALVRDGKIRAWGCSNHAPDEMQALISALGPIPVSAQVHYNLIERRTGLALAELCQDQGLGMIVNRGLARGILTGKYSSDGAIHPQSRAAMSDRVARLLEPAVLRLVHDLEKLAREYDMSATQVALAWLLTQPAVSIVLVGARNTEQLDHCLDAANLTLPSELSMAIDRLIAQHELTEQINARPTEFLET